MLSLCAAARLMSGRNGIWYDGVVGSDSYGRVPTGAICPLLSLVPQLVIMSLAKPGEVESARPGDPV